MHQVQKGHVFTIYNYIEVSRREKTMRRRSKCGDCNIVGDRISQIRKAKGIGQGELIIKIQLLNADISQSKLSRIEGRQIAVSDSDLFIIAQALQVNISDLFPPLPYQSI